MFEEISEPFQKHLTLVPLSVLSCFFLLPIVLKNWWEIYKSVSTLIINRKNENSTWLRLCRTWICRFNILLYSAIFLLYLPYVFLTPPPFPLTHGVLHFGADSHLNLSEFFLLFFRNFSLIEFYKYFLRICLHSDNHRDSW